MIICAGWFYSYNAENHSCFNVAGGKDIKDFIFPG
jgi:hypothetical protein